LGGGVYIPIYPVATPLEVRSNMSLDK